MIYAKQSKLTYLPSSLNTLSLVTELQIPLAFWADQFCWCPILNVAWTQKSYRASLSSGVEVGIDHTGSLHDSCYSWAGLLYFIMWERSILSSLHTLAYIVQSTWNLFPDSFCYLASQNCAALILPFLHLPWCLTGNFHSRLFFLTSNFMVMISKCQSTNILLVTNCSPYWMDKLSIQNEINKNSVANFYIDEFISFKLLTIILIICPS